MRKEHHINRNQYQIKRYNFLKEFVSINSSIGLEIGACNLPTVPMTEGLCRYADFRTADQMTSMWELDPASVCYVDYVIDRNRKLPDQISDRFDYVIACHVLEHVPDPIGYLMELSGLLKPNGIAFLAVPDKRRTNDKNRPSTTIDHLLMDFYDGCRYPSIEHIMDFHRHWLEIETGKALEIAGVFDYASNFHASGKADVHCHVWDDNQFRDQFRTLSTQKLLGDLELTAFDETHSEYNEFVAIFKKQ